MALLDQDGYDMYGTIAQFNQAVNQTTSATAINTTAGQQRTGRAALTVNANPSYVRRLFSSSGAMLCCGKGIYWITVTSSAVVRPIRFFSSSTSRSGLSFARDSSGRLTVGYGGPTTNIASVTPTGVVLWTGTDSEPVGSYQHYELKVVHKADTTGSWSLWRNGALVQAQSGVQTMVNASDDMDTVIGECQAAAGSGFVEDDYYLVDDTGTENTDRLGPVRAFYSPPTGNDTAGWTPSAGTNWQNVDDTTPDDDTTYNLATPSGLPKTDLFTRAALPAEATIIRAVKNIWRGRKEDAAVAEVRGLIKSGSSEGLGTTRALDTVHTYYSDIYQLDPATSAAFSPSAVNALLNGYRRVT